MTTNKTTTTDVDVKQFINDFVDSEQKKQDSYALLDLMESISGSPPVMWGPSIIGFGKYAYKYPSGHQGEAPLIGFSPRKKAISLYVFTGLEEHYHLLNSLGKFKKAAACIYVNQLKDIDLDALKVLMTTTITYLKNRYPN